MNMTTTSPRNPLRLCRDLPRIEALGAPQRGEESQLISGRPSIWRPRAMALATLLALSAKLQAALILQTGAVNLQPNLAGQVIDFFVQNDSASEVLVSGLEFSLQVGDSGPGSEGGLGTVDGPNITSANLLTDTPFATDNEGTPANLGFPQLAIYSLGTGSGDPVSLPGNTSSKLARVTFDTTGFASGVWSLAFGNTLNDATKYLYSDGVVVVDVPLTITDGTLSISVVPEPGDYALAAGGSLVAFALLRSRARRLTRHSVCGG